MIPERLVPGTLEWEYFHHEHEQRYRFFADRYACLDVLDAACGVGYGSAIIARHGAKSVTGIDIDESTIAYAAKNFARPAITFQTLGAEHLTRIGRKFDLVVSFETIEHLSDPSRFLQEVHDVLTPRGTFICSTPNRDFCGKGDNYVNPYHLSEMAFDEFASVFQTHFTLEEQYHQSPSEAYRRHVQLVGEIGRLEKAIRFSKLLAIENRLRRWLGRDHWLVHAPSSDLTRVVPGDFVLEPLENPLKSHLTFILVGRAKA